MAKRKRQSKKKPSIGVLYSTGVSGLMKRQKTAKIHAKAAKRKAVSRMPSNAKRTNADKSGLFWAGRKKKSNPWNAYIKSTCAPGYKKSTGRS